MGASPRKPRLARNTRTILCQRPQATLAHEILRLPARNELTAENCEPSNWSESQRGATRQQDAEINMLRMEFRNHAQMVIGSRGSGIPSRANRLSSARKIQRAQQSANAEDRRACQPNIYASLLARRKNEAVMPTSETTVSQKETRFNVGTPSLKRQSAAAANSWPKPSCGAAVQHKENHQRPVQQAHRGVALGSVFKPFRNGIAVSGKNCAYESSVERTTPTSTLARASQRYWQPNRFVVGGKDVAREKRGTGGLGRVGAVIVSDHFYTVPPIGGP